MDMPKFGFTTNPLRSPEKDVKRIAKSGFDFIELGVEAPGGLAENLAKQKEKIKSAIKKYDTCIPVVHTAWWMEFGSQYETVRKAWIAEAKKAIRIARYFDAEMVCFHAHSRGMALKDKKHKKDVLRISSNSMKELVKYAKPYGIKIMLENTAGKGEIKQFGDFKWIVDHTKGLYVHLDIGHAFIMGGMKEIERYIKAFKKKLIYIHMHDNHGEEDEHLGFGEGSIDFMQVVKLLKKSAYSGPIGFEVFSSWGMAKQSLKIMKDLWNKA